MKQGQSSTPADILVDISNPYNSANGLNYGLNCPVEYVSAGVDDCPCFITFYCYV